MYCENKIKMKNIKLTGEMNFLTSLLSVVYSKNLSVYFLIFWKKI